MVVILLLFCFITICFVIFAYAEREETRARQAQISKDLADLKVLIEADAYRDKILLNQREDEAEV
jgi:hypothetical protein